MNGFYCPAPRPTRRERVQRTLLLAAGIVLFYVAAAYIFAAGYVAGLAQL